MVYCFNIGKNEQGLELNGKKKQISKTGNIDEDSSRLHIANKNIIFSAVLADMKLLQFKGKRFENSPLIVIDALHSKGFRSRSASTRPIEYFDHMM